MLINFSIGVSRGTLTHMRAYQPLSVVDVHTSILTSLPTFFQTLAKIEFSGEFR